MAEIFEDRLIFTAVMTDSFYNESEDLVSVPLCSITKQKNELTVISSGGCHYDLSQEESDSIDILLGMGPAGYFPVHFDNLD